MAAYDLLKPFLFALDAERAHHFASTSLRILQRLTPLLDAVHAHYAPDEPRLRRRIMGLDFPNPIGLAAGFDKDGLLIEAMAALGFGFVEVGTVTPRPQSGNPRPRLFRHPKIASLQNAMGFNNAGMEALHARLLPPRRYQVPVGVNLGKNKATPESGALQEYLSLLDRLADVGDYYVINVSSPNTPGLRDLQNESFVTELFSRAKEKTAKPVLLKVSPDGPIEGTVSLCNAAVEHGASGIIATNTSVDYSLYAGAKDFGGLSGSVIREKSFEVFRAIAAELRGKAALISVGGVDSPAEAQRRFDAGADLVQLYTGLIYGGPGFPSRIGRGIAG